MNAARRAHALKITSLESLDQRLTPSGVTPVLPAAVVPPVYTPTGGALDKLGQSLNIIYQEYQAYQNLGGHGTFVSSQAGQVIFGGTTANSVAVNIRVRGDLNLVASELKGIGMQVGAVDAANKVVTGYLPISQLATVARDANIVGLSPVYRPFFRGSVGFGHR